MHRSKKVTASLLAAGALVMGAGIASAVDLPDQPDASVADEKVADAGKGGEAEPQANAAEHRQNLEAGGADDVAGVEGEGEGERPTDTHGYAVSQLATTTELEGREKGEAISALAKTNGGGEGADDASSSEVKGKSAEAHAAHGK